MQVGLNPPINVILVTRNFNDYTFRSHVMRPIVLMVAGFVIAIFAGIAFSTVLGTVCRATPRKAYRVEVNEQEFKSNSIQYLFKLANKIIKSNCKLDLNIRFLKGNGKEAPSIGIALQRQYFVTLFEGLKKHYSELENSDFLLYKTKTNELLIPQSDPPMNFDQETFSVYYAIGAVMMYVFFNKENYLIGQVFHPAIFSAILSLTDEEIDLPYDQLTDKAKLNMCKGLICAQIDAGENLMNLLVILPFLQKKEKATDDEIENLTTFYGSAFDIAEVEDVNLNKFLLLDERTKNDGREYSCDLPEYRLDIPAIRANIDEFHCFCLNRLFDDRENSLGVISKTFYPLHTMAKGMKRLAGEHWSKQICFSSDASSSSSSNSDSVIEVGNRLNRKIQGELDRQILISKVVVHSQSPIVLRQWNWMKNWIINKNTPINKIEGLLIFWTGSPCIDWEKQKYIHIDEQDKGPYPGAGGCSFRLRLPNRDFKVENPYAPGVSNMTEEGFSEILNQISTDRGWTQV